MKLKLKESIIIALFISFIGGIGLFNVFTKDTAFSEFENRPLAQFPTFTKERFLSGAFNRDFETYLSDQFFGKEWWTGLKVKAEKVVFKQENNGVYFGEDGFLFEKPTPISGQLDKNILYLNKFKENHAGRNVYLALAPTSIELYPEKLPLFAQTGIQEEAIEHISTQLNSDIQLIDLFMPLQEKKGLPIFYRTDHHWTTRGAFYGYQETAKMMGIKPFQLEDFTSQTVSEDFLGTFYSKANDHQIQPDELEVFIPKKPYHYEITYGDGTTLDSLYADEFLTKRDKYSFFTGGNHAKVIITSSVKNDQKLLLVKDSYAHAMVPFLANHFEEIHMVDLRYYHESIQTYLDDHAINDVLILYNTANFIKDTSIIYLSH